MPQQDSSVRKKSNYKRWSSLSPHHFGDWAHSSEGSTNSIYLVNKDGFAKEVSAEVHGQKRRNLRDGRMIDKVNTWFGPRSVPFSDGNTSRIWEEKPTLMEGWQSIKDQFLNLEYQELIELSKWFQDTLSEKDKCEMIEVVMDCDKFKTAIGASWWSNSIKSNLKVNFAKLSEIASKEWIDDLPKFSEVIGSKGFLYISKLSSYEAKFGRMFDIWLKKEIDREANKLSEKDLSRKNGVDLIRKILTSQMYSEGCEEYKKNAGERIVYGECFTKDHKDFGKLPQSNGEKYMFPKVVDVVKAARWFSEPGFVPSKYVFTESGTPEQTSKVNDKQWISYPKTGGLFWQANSKFWASDGWKGVIDVECATVPVQKDTSLASWFVGEPLEKRGCVEFYRLVFSGDIKDKRWCLFEIPETKSFVKETQVFGPFMVSSWNNGNRFWTRCSTYEI
ncbi:hypothetical protein MSUIS_04850 [Mycoplasma suis KI3806]|uniref:Uncharacterized protein n=2 Tax=Mycoplasma suis TaxID=57372 RepID=F0V1P7_MYCS3|nr:hypothetical protein MSUIS_04850 [Mycoplasma suis KI3806]